jgi:hypothetical protein
VPPVLPPVPPVPPPVLVVPPIPPVPPTLVEPPVPPEPPVLVEVLEFILSRSTSVMMLQPLTKNRMIHNCKTIFLIFPLAEFGSCLQEHLFLTWGNPQFSPTYSSNRKLWGVERDVPVQNPNFERATGILVYAIFFKLFNLTLGPLNRLHAMRD